MIHGESAKPAQHAPEIVRIGVVGHGVVGSAFTALVARQHDVIAARTGVSLRVTRIAVRDAGKHPAMVGEAPVGTDPLALAADPDIDLVVEVMGGTGLAGDVIRTALEHGKPVVTANKALLAAQSADLFKIAENVASTCCLKQPCVAAFRSSVRCARACAANRFAGCWAS